MSWRRPLCSRSRKSWMSPGSGPVRGLPLKNGDIFSTLIYAISEKLPKIYTSSHGPLDITKQLFLRSINSEKLWIRVFQTSNVRLQRETNPRWLSKRNKLSTQNQCSCQSRINSTKNKHTAAGYLTLFTRCTSVYFTGMEWRWWSTTFWKLNQWC